MNVWIVLVLVGFFEVGFMMVFKLEQQNKNWGWVFIVCVWISFGFLVQVIEIIFFGMVYVVWIGIGVVGMVLVGWVFFGEQFGGCKFVLLVVMVVVIFGLKVMV